MATTVAAETVIPELDLAPYLAGEPGAEAALVEALRSAQETVGFYYVVGHGVERAFIDGCFRALADFFALPMEDKLALEVGDSNIGYLPFGGTIYRTSQWNENTERDAVEAFNLVAEGEPRLAGDGTTGTYVPRNKWPAALPGFETTMRAYHGRMVALGRALLPLYALALGQERDFFAPAFARPRWVNRNGHYPPQRLRPNQFGISPHSDAGFLTLLPVNEVPGLEIRLPDGRWIAAPVVEGAILVNTGEFLNRWTNGRFLATPHRVRAVERDRYSLAFFFNPSDETVADPLASCIDAAHPKRFEPISSFDYRNWYTRENFLHRRDADRARRPDEA